jgi:NADH dehydrogenase [ubiquinone] 1 alpha subcomplex assembly factor 7
VIETSPASLNQVRRLAGRMIMHGGAALVVDYGHDRTSAGETLQAVRAHEYADPWTEPGTRDLTAHVDFEALQKVAGAAGLRTHGPIGQGEWLTSLGIDARARALVRTSPGRKQEVLAARDRLVATEAMGRLFRILGLSAPDWPAPEGFG